MTERKQNSSKQPESSEQAEHKATKNERPKAPKEIGGRAGLDPVRYGDWEKGGRCIDF